jgi:hypothetical protein
VEPRDARAYVERGWAAAERLKQEHWAREFRERGPEATLEAARALREHMRLVNPDWPSESERRDDLDHHIALKRAIDAAARAFLQRAARDPSR